MTLRFEGYAALAELFRKLVDGILWVAPVGIGALLAETGPPHD